MRVRSNLALTGLAALLGVSGLLHLVLPRIYEGIVPTPLHPIAGEVVAVSGVAELACAVLLILPTTRRLGGWTTAVLLIAVFPANIQMALNGGAGLPAPLNHSALLWARLPLQAPLVWCALRLARDGRRVPRERYS